jgi:hypothetical protein
MKPHSLPTLFALLGSLSASFGHTQTILYDPFRPPNALLPNTSSENNSATNNRSMPQANSNMYGGKVQMLLIGQHRSTALIDGHVLKLGELINQWKLVSIDPQNIVMRNASVTEKISINPSVVKTIRATKQSDKSVDSDDKNLSRSHP